jgi:hypothetical protein
MGKYESKIDTRILKDIIILDENNLPLFLAVI